jgi:hypothetical protein
MLRVRHEPGYDCTQVQNAPDGVTVWFLNRFWQNFKPSDFAKADEATPHRVSIGIMHTLLSTARETLGRKVTRKDLLDDAVSIEAGAAYIAKQRSETLWDPPLVGAAYNAGSIRRNDSAANRWKMVMYPIGTGAHVDRWVKWYNDAVAVVGSLPQGTFPVTHSKFYFP